MPGKLLRQKLWVKYFNTVLKQRKAEPQLFLYCFKDTSGCFTAGLHKTIKSHTHEREDKKQGSKLGNILTTTRGDELDGLN